MGWIDDDTFQFFVPAQIIDIEKSSKPGAKGKRGDKSTKRWIQGVASTASRDLQGEIIDQGGIDFTYFLQHGWFNNDHRPGFKNKVGQPTEAKITKNGLWVKGFLLEEHGVADEIWELMHSLETTQSDRRLGFSIQGKVKERVGNRIKKCWIMDVAITPAPVNTTTWAEIAKSLSAHKWDLTNKGHVDGPQIPLHGAHSVLGVESPEGDEKDCESDEDAKKALTLNEAVSFLEVTHGLPRSAAQNVARAIFTTIPGETHD
jgi:hypothetical protein